MGQDKFELFVKDKIGEYQSPIDSDALWSQLEQAGATATTAGTASGIFASASAKWIVGSIIALTLVGTSIFFLQERHLEAMSKSANQTGESSPTSIQSQSDLENFKTIATKEINQVTSNLSDLSTGNKAIESNNTGTQARKNSLNRTSNVPAKSPISDRTIVNTGVAKTTGSESTYAVSVSENRTYVANSIPPSTATPSTTETTITPNTTAFAEKGSTDSKESSIAAEFAVDQSSMATSNIGLMSLVQMENTIKHQAPQPIACPDFGNRRGGSGTFGIEIQAIPYYSMKRYNALDDLGEEWMITRKATESYLESFQINALLRYQHSSGIYAHAGIGYGQIDEKLQLNTEDLMDVTVDTVTIIIFQPNGDIDTIVGPVIGEEQTTVEAVTYNYHRMIELPFAIGYELPVSNKFGIYADVGGSLNLAVFRTGSTVVDQTDIVPFDSTSRPVYRTSTGFKVKGSMGIRYYTESGITLSAGPEVRYHTANWLRSELTLEQRYLDVGIRFAAGYTF